MVAYRRQSYRIYSVPVPQCHGERMLTTQSSPMSKAGSHTRAFWLNGCEIELFLVETYINLSGLSWVINQLQKLLYWRTAKIALYLNSIIGVLWNCLFKQTPGVDLTRGWCWDNVVEGVPTLIPHWSKLFISLKFFRTNLFEPTNLVWYTFLDDRHSSVSYQVNNGPGRPKNTWISSLFRIHVWTWHTSLSNSW